MKNKLTLIFILLLSATLSKDILHDYLWPSNASHTITTVFGDERSRRFHAGIDVRTYGQIGKEIYAVESGYVDRVKITHNGYGKALYLRLDDGNTALYAHLDKFHQIIEDRIKAERTSNNSSFVDIYFKKNEIRFEKGDIIALSGDTGSISGPHLHFEIRNNKGEPINPLNKYFSIKDTLNPVAESIAFIPLDNSCWINGVQDYSIFKLEKNNEYKYILMDTVSIIGNFGLAIEVKDKINKQPFNFGIYSIELLIDNKLMYELKFNEYDFSHDPLIYRETDFYLLNNFSKIYHRLYVNNNSELNFINSHSNHGLNLDENFHNLIINISDINQNKIQIQGILKGDIAISPDLLYDENTMTLFSENGFEKINLNFTTRYNHSKLIPLSFTQIDSQYIKLFPLNEPYSVLEYYIKNNNGLKSKNKFIALNNYDPYQINGKTKIKHFDNGIIIEFVEDVYSGYLAECILEYNDNETLNLELYRKEKIFYLQASLILINLILLIQYLLNIQPSLKLSLKRT